MKMAFVIDTNVPVVANRRAPQASERRVLACINKLMEVQSDGRLVLDDKSLILNEYLRNLSPKGQPGVGDAFFKWLWLNQGNPDLCERVEVHTRGQADDDFEEFPEDPALAGFDRGDRKFVAVARASKSRPRPSILNAVDSDWWIHRHALKRHEIEIEFLCPEVFSSNRCR
jgi:hypothetical protein